MSKPDRAKPAHFQPDFRANGENRVFVTVCTKDRKPILANDGFHRAFLVVAETCESWKPSEYMIMPDHLHIILSAATPDPNDLTKWVPWLKSQLTKTWLTRPEGKIWQQGYWDTRIRNDHHHAEITDYMRQNPVTKNLTHSPQDWPYQGALLAV